MGATVTPFPLPRANWRCCIPCPPTTRGPQPWCWNTTSEAASPKPIFLRRYELDPDRPVPPTVSARLTFNGVAGQEFYYASGDLNPGDLVQIALQADGSALPTGRYPWQIDVIAHYGSGDVTTTTTGMATVLNYGSSPVGPGWQVGGLSRLFGLAEGAILDLGDGHSLWFAWDPQSQTYLTPDRDFSTLVRNPDNTFTRTLKSGEEFRFDPAGKLTAFVDRNSNTVVYGYDAAGRLASITDPNGQVTSFAYTGEWLSSITDPAGRTTALSHDAQGRLVQIADADSSTWSFSYDARRHLTGRTDPRNATTTFAYDTFGRLSGTTRADGTTDALVAYQTQGLLAPGTGTPEAPGAAVLWAAAASTYTDGRGKTWWTRFDWTGFGTATGQLDPLGHLAVTHRDADGLPSQQTDQLDRNTVYWRDSRGNVTKVIHGDYTTETFAYNGYSQVTQHTDAGGKVYTYQYDAWGNLLQVTDPLGQVQSYTYTADGLVATATDPAGRVTKFFYDSRDRLVEKILPDSTPGDEDNPRELFTWDAAGNQTSRTDPLGQVTQMAYSTLGLLTALVLPDETPGNPDDNPRYTFSYDTRGNRTSQVDPLGHTTTWQYDLLGRVTSETDPLGATTQFAYDAEGNQTAVTDPLGQVTTFAFDDVGNLVQVTDPLTQSTTFTVDPARQVIQRIDPLQNTTNLAYNVRGWLASVTDPANGTTYRGYTPQGWLATRQESGGGSKVYSYDAAGRVTALSDELGYQTTLAYDSAGNLLSRTDPLGHTTTWQYDAQNRLVAATDPLGNTTTYCYDLAGNLLSVTDPLGRVTSYQYDAQNRVIKTTDANGAETHFAYDPAGRLTSVTDALGNVTRYTLDADGRLVAETDPLSHQRLYSYDSAGRIIEMQDRNGRRRTFSYDAAGRRTAETWLDPQGQPLRTFSFGYDADGRLTTASDPSASSSFTYDADSRLTSVTTADIPGLPQVTLSFGYNDRDDRETLTDSFGVQTVFQYDLAHRMTSLRNFGVGIAQPEITLQYDPAGRLVHLSRQDLYASGGWPVESSFSYDAAHRVTAITHTAGQATLASYAFSWDAAGQLVQEVSNDGTVNYAYDRTGQLLSATGWRNETFTYDLLGNRTMPGYQTGPGNRLLSDGTFQYTYDPEGNMLTKTEIATGRVTEYTWDGRNRLTRVVLKDAQGTVLRESNYTYDVFDKRIGVAVDPDGQGPQVAAQQWTIYDGLNPYADFDGQGNVTHRYLYGPAVDRIMARLGAEGDIAWYLGDHLGTVRDLADTSGQVIDHIAYDSFGGILAETNPAVGDRFKFTAREFDAASEQYYYRARYYDPRIGRFTSEDPLGLAAGDVNVFRYVINRPVVLCDPTGTDSTFPEEPATPALDPLGASGGYPSRNVPAPHSLPTRGETEVPLPSRPASPASVYDDPLWIGYIHVKARLHAITADLRSLTAAARNFTVAPGTNECERWASAFQASAPKSPYYRLTPVVWTYRFYSGFPQNWRLRHVALRVEVFFDTQRPFVLFYLDNGWWGGADHLFFPYEIPRTVYEGP